MITTLFKTIIISITMMLFNSVNTNQYVMTKNTQNTNSVTNNLTTYSDIKVFQILENKCNVCHRKRNKRRIFTQQNMYTWKNDIYQQVFVKKRMPKGKKVKLTTEEYQELLAWISSIKNNENGNKY